MRAGTFCVITRAITVLLAVLLVGCGRGAGPSIAITGNTQGPDPVVQDFPVAYVDRPLVTETGLARAPQRSLDVFEPGARLILKARAGVGADEANLLAALAPEGDPDPTGYDVRDLSVDFDGNRLVFALRGPYIEGADPEDQPGWNIWIYDVGRDELRRVIESDTVAEAGQDRQPHFLPDGRIVFTSTRQRQSRAVLLDEGRPQFAALDEDRREPAFVLHVMDDDGNNIQQISFNQSHDRDPAVMPDGEIVFSRWDNVPGRDVISLYRIHPDGTQLEPLYGYHSMGSGRDGSDIVFLDPRPLDDGRVLTLAMRNRSDMPGGDPLLLDVANFTDINQPVFANTGATTDAQIPLVDDIVKLSEPSPPGRFASVWPLHDGTGRFLAAWSQCRLQDAAGVIVPCSPDRLGEDPPPAEAPALFGLWLFDPANQTQLPVVAPHEGVVVSEAVALAPGIMPWVLQPASADDRATALAAEGAGLLDIRSVYDVDGTDTGVTPPLMRPATFLRLVKPVSLPGRDLVNLRGAAFGVSTGELMREIIGYANVNPDGSVLVKVPANVAFAISVLDKNGRRITPRHRNWLQVRPGETLHCHGCHEPNSSAPHGRSDAEAPSIIASDQTMAETIAAQSGVVPAPTMDLVFDDIWTDPAQRTPDPGFAFLYQDLETPAPVASACINAWQANCRINISYPANINPLWSVDRREFGADGITLVADRTCTACHSPVDSMGMPRVPDGQLDLVDAPSPDQPDQLNSYRELLVADNEQVLVNGVLVDRMVPVVDAQGSPVYQTDQDGNPLLDQTGNPVPVLTPVTVRPVLSTAGANASRAFFALFDAGGSHAGYLSDAEQKLLSEWLDIGAQYYNDPFEVPQ